MENKNKRKISDEDMQKIFKELSNKMSGNESDNKKEKILREDNHFSKKERDEEIINSLKSAKDVLFLSLEDYKKGSGLEKGTFIMNGSALKLMTTLIQRFFSDPMLNDLLKISILRELKSIIKDKIK